jgi:hypothetical protein
LWQFADCHRPFLWDLWPHAKDEWQSAKAGWYSANCPRQLAVALWQSAKGAWQNGWAHRPEPEAETHSSSARRAFAYP